ncbi:MAG TPA: hypothetical protein VGL59_25400 [Polyangia bacterium]|jgi:hypothetical protein
MTDCPSSLTVAAWEAGTLDDSAERQRLLVHARVCQHCAALVDEIAVARGELLDDDPAAAAARAAHMLMAIAAQRRAAVRPRRRRFWQVLGIPVLVGAAGGLLLAPKLTALFNPVSSLSLSPPPASRADVPGLRDPSSFGVRAKGQLVLEAFCKRQDSVFPVEDGGSFVSGDRLRFAYSALSAGHLMIFGVDDRGQIFPYYGDDNLSSVPVAAGSKVMLPGSIELDNHHGWERLFALWSTQPADAGAVKRAVADALAEAHDITRVGKLAVPAEQVSYLLRRP